MSWTELEKRGNRYVCYADDFSIYLRSRQVARRVGNSIYLFLKERLKLPTNCEKSGIKRPMQFTLLGYSFVSTFKNGEAGKYQLVVSRKAWTRLKQTLKRLTRKSTPMIFDERLSRLRMTYMGWLNYFRLANIQGKLKKLDVWLRSLIRYYIWHNWKKPDRKRKNMIRLGRNSQEDYACIWTRMGGCAVAQSPILKTTITLSRVETRGYQSMASYYNKLSHAL